MGWTCDKASSNISSPQAHSSLAAQNILSVMAFNMQEREIQCRLAHTKENFFLAYITTVRFDVAVSSVMAIAHFLSCLPSVVELHTQLAFLTVVKRLQQF